MKAFASVYFPEGKASNVLRGAMGTEFRRISCVPQCPGSLLCDIAHSCPYALIFEPKLQDGPSGLADPPRPFVFRAAHLNGLTFQAGTEFHFGLNVFSLDPKVLAYFVITFSSLAQQGLGPGRAKAELSRVASGTQVLFTSQQNLLNEEIEPLRLSLTPKASAPARIRVHFITPTELKSETKVTRTPEFRVLFALVRDRISTLSSLYGSGPINVDFAASNARAASVHLVKYEAHKQTALRKSAKTGQTHSIGGFTGFAEYEGDLGEFIPYLEAAKWTGVGRQSVWGNGEIEVEPL